MSTGTLTASGAATAASFAATGALTGATLTITGAASTGPLDCESLDCTFTATSGGVSTGSVVCGDVTSSGTVSTPQLFASNTLIVTNTSDFSDNLFLTKNWAGWSKLQVSNNSAQRPAAAGQGLPGAGRAAPGSESCRRSTRCCGGGARRPAPQGSGNAAGRLTRRGSSCEAAGQLPGASEAQDPRLVLFGKNGLRHCVDLPASMANLFLYDF